LKAGMKLGKTNPPLSEVKKAVLLKYLSRRMEKWQKHPDNPV
jgi:hypothetical protein